MMTQAVHAQNPQNVLMRARRQRVERVDASDGGCHAGLHTALSPILEPRLLKLMDQRLTFVRTAQDWQYEDLHMLLLSNEVCKQNLRR